MALEPYLRRRWPRLLISWARLSSGRFRDPLVGRDLLAGISVGAVVAVINYLEGALGYWINVRGVIPIGHDFSVNSLSDLGRFVGVFPYSVQTSAFGGLTTLTVLVLARVLFRRNWLAIAITLLVLTAVDLSAENILFDLPITAFEAALLVFVLVRFGLLAFTVSWVPPSLMVLTPITLRLSHWYAWRSVFVLLSIMAVALCGFRMAMAGRPTLGNLAFDD
jgi:hypothetical protein